MNTTNQIEIVPNKVLVTGASGLLGVAQANMDSSSIVDPFENPSRATTLIASLERAGLQRTEPADYGREPILKVHASHYVTFLEEERHQPRVKTGA
jgi:acetoin utilization deacetylase AcuC-like enzyme